MLKLSGAHLALTISSVSLGSRTEWAELLVWVWLLQGVYCPQSSYRRGLLLPFEGCLGRAIVLAVVQMMVLKEQSRCAERKEDGTDNL